MHSVEFKEMRAIIHTLNAKIDALEQRNQGILFWTDADAKEWRRLQSRLDRLPVEWERLKAKEVTDVS